MLVFLIPKDSSSRSFTNRASSSRLNTKKKASTSGGGFPPAWRPASSPILSEAAVVHNNRSTHDPRPPIRVSLQAPRPAHYDRHPAGSHQSDPPVHSWHRVVSPHQYPAAHRRDRWPAGHTSFGSSGMIHSVNLARSARCLHPMIGENT